MRAVDVMVEPHGYGLIHDVDGHRPHWLGHLGRGPRRPHRRLGGVGPVAVNLTDGVLKAICAAYNSAIGLARPKHCGVALSQKLATGEEKADESGVAEAASGPSSTPDRVGVAGGA